MVVAQLVERLLPTPEVRSSFPISDINIGQYSTSCSLKKTKIKEKEAGKGPSLKKLNILDFIGKSKLENKSPTGLLKKFRPIRNKDISVLDS